jgi:hypothetical protein
VPDRVKVIFAEHQRSEQTHMGEMTSLDQATGRAEVTFDSGEAVTINACCLQHQDQT